MTVSPEHADCNRSFYGTVGPGGLPPGVPPVDPDEALYAPAVTTIGGVEHRWTLRDVEELRRRHPETFFIPPADRRRALRVGDSARLIFAFTPRREGDPNAERMWVRVAGADERGYAAYLTNQPVFVKGLDAGDVIGFDARHVASIEVTDDELGFEVEARAFVSMRVAEGAAPGYVCRRPPSERQPPRRDAHGWAMVDSGWDVLAGDETDSELDDAQAVVLWELGWLAERCPELQPLLRGGHESGEWVRAMEAGGLRRIG